MHLKTAVTLISGAAVGFFFGCCIPDEAKEKEIGRIKKKLIFLLTGEEWEKKKKPVVSYTGGYKRYTDYREPKVKTLSTWSEIRQELLFFKRYDEAEQFIGRIEKYLEEHPYISVHSLCMMRDRYVDYTWDKYGWSHEDILVLDKKPLFEVDKTEYYVYLPEPKMIA